MSAVSTPHSIFVSVTIQSHNTARPFDLLISCASCAPGPRFDNPHFLCNQQTNHKKFKTSCLCRR